MKLCSHKILKNNSMNPPTNVQDQVKAYCNSLTLSLANKQTAVVAQKFSVKLSAL